MRKDQSEGGGKDHCCVVSVIHWVVRSSPWKENYWDRKTCTCTYIHNTHYISIYTCTHMPTHTRTHAHTSADTKSL